MTVYAVNGLGRIGKLALKPLLDRGRGSHGSTMPWAIRRCTRTFWSSTPSTVAGTRPSPSDADSVTVNGTRLPFVGTRDLSDLPLDGVDVVIDCTGVFKTEAALAPYFAAGVKKVVVSAPGQGRRCRQYRLRRQSRHLRPRAAPDRDGGVLHDKLPRPGGEGRARGARHPSRLYHHDP
jgi:glyceraldehyde-3-phosphate dehydrogenase/erythrose-4-phosphate dehydrogenase